MSANSTSTISDGPMEPCTPPSSPVSLEHWTSRANGDRGTPSLEEERGRAEQRAAIPYRSGAPSPSPGGVAWTRQQAENGVSRSPTPSDTAEGRMAGLARTDLTLPVYGPRTCPPLWTPTSSPPHFSVLSLFPSRSPSPSPAPRRYPRARARSQATQLAFGPDDALPSIEREAPMSSSMELVMRAPEMPVSVPAPQPAQVPSEQPRVQEQVQAQATRQVPLPREIEVEIPMGTSLDGVLLAREHHEPPSQSPEPEPQPQSQPQSQPNIPRPSHQKILARKTPCTSTINKPQQDKFNWQDPDDDDERNLEGVLIVGGGGGTKKEEERREARLNKGRRKWEGTSTSEEGRGHVQLLMYRGREYQAQKEKQTQAKLGVRAVPVCVPVFGGDCAGPFSSSSSSSSLSGRRVDPPDKTRGTLG